MVARENNGFLFHDNNGNNGGSFLQATKAGLYSVNGEIVAEWGNGGEYGLGIVKNWVDPETGNGLSSCYGHKNGGGLHSSFPVDGCMLRLAVGDNVSIMVDDENNPAQSLNVILSRVSLVRIGD